LASADDARERSRRLLGSIEGLANKLTGDGRPQAGSHTPAELARLEQTRAAVAADYYNEGLPLAQLRAEGVWLPPADAPDASI
jgi:hypothetical protein